jgi:hypothetical protein
MKMTEETKNLARQIFVAAMSSAEGLGTIDENRRKELLTMASKMSIEAATVFESVLENT